MTTKFFFCCLTPTSHGPQYHFSLTFAITYSSDTNLEHQRNNLDVQFRNFLGNPNNYNCEWSVGDTQLVTETERQAEILQLGASAIAHNWPF